MHPAKKVSVSFRVSTQSKQCLEKASELEQSSQTYVLEKLLFDYCRLHRIGDQRNSTVVNA